MIRKREGLSQRELALKAHIAYKTLQLIESGKHDPKLSTLEKIAKALDYPEGIVESAISHYLSLEHDSIRLISLRICQNGEASWKIWLFNFVDAFRRNPGKKLIDLPPVSQISLRIQCLLASTVEALCAEVGMEAPSWCFGIGALPEPWFVAGVESLKPMALVESSVYFKKRNIFVLNNFLDRA